VYGGDFVEFDEFERFQVKLVLSKTMKRILFVPEVWQVKSKQIDLHSVDGFQ
jgi:hypothetical protein